MSVENEEELKILLLENGAENLYFKILNWHNNQKPSAWEILDAVEEIQKANREAQTPLAQKHVIAGILEKHFKK